jgi:hypothetical protein
MSTVVSLRPHWSFLTWSQWLDRAGVQLGQDYHWYWNHQDQCWAAEFANPVAALAVSLQIPEVTL